ncbi:hypothetical protein BDZ89DRAFT_1039085 [Hymenopellis radicata]|nr:hypothetical protein BDZ89DRAFT_1039085 [Hymenopellis radicata]
MSHYSAPSTSSCVYRPLRSISDKDLHKGMLVNPASMARYTALHPHLPPAHTPEPHAHRRRGRKAVSTSDADSARPISKNGPWATADEILNSHRRKPARYNPHAVPLPSSPRPPVGYRTTERQSTVSIMGSLRGWRSGQKTGQQQRITGIATSKTEISKVCRGDPLLRRKKPVEHVGNKERRSFVCGREDKWLAHIWQPPPTAGPEQFRGIFVVSLLGSVHALLSSAFLNKLPVRGFQLLVFNFFLVFAGADTQLSKRHATRTAGGIHVPIARRESHSFERRTDAGEIGVRQLF